MLSFEFDHDQVVHARVRFKLHKVVCSARRGSVASRIASGARETRAIGMLLCTAKS